MLKISIIEKWEIRTSPRLSIVEDTSGNKKVPYQVIKVGQGGMEREGVVEGNIMILQIIIKDSVDKVSYTFSNRREMGAKMKNDTHNIT